MASFNWGIYYGRSSSLIDLFSVDAKWKQIRI